MSAPLPTAKGRRGLTLVETMISLTLLVLMLTGIESVLGSARRQYASGSRAMSLERRGAQALGRVVGALRAADPDSISVVPMAPLATSEITFQLNEGYEGQQVSWSPPVRIRLEPDGRISRTDALGLPEERTGYWGHDIAPLLEGETLNGLDDNGNGLIDEPGLCVSRQGQLLSIALTLSVAAPGGAVQTHTWSTQLHCRN